MPLDMELEGIMRTPDLPMPPYPPKVVTMATGKQMVIRQVGREDVPALLEAVRPTLDITRDFYDVVGARFYAELLSWQKYRAVNYYCIIGQIDGILVGLVNGRMYTKDIGMSLHTMTIERGLRVGGHLFAAKMEYHMEILDQKEVLIVVESPIGMRRFLIDFELEPRPSIPHELGGVPSNALTRELWFKHRPRLVVGERPVPKELMEVAEREIIPPTEALVNAKIMGDERMRRLI
jgi:hypothetical protein